MMADNEVATKAPEFDDAEVSPISEESPALAGPAQTEPPHTEPTLGDHCTTDRPAPPGHHPTGEITKLGDVETYVTKPSDYPHTAGRLLLFLTNGVGIHSNNNQLQADKYAREGFLVVMPDLFAGDAAPNSSSSDTNKAQGSDPTLIEQVKLRAAETAKSFLLDMWLARHTVEKVMPILHKVIEAAKDEFADAVANGGGIYGVGYCFGGKYILRLAGEHPDTVMWGQAAKDEEEGVVKTGPLIKVAAIAHGTLVTREDLVTIKAPLSMVCVEDDQLFPDEIREEGRKHLEENKVEHEIKVFPGVPHGFAVLGEYDDQHIATSQKEAFVQILGWLKSH